LTKRKRSRRRAAPPTQGPRQPSVELQEALDRAEGLAAQGRAWEAIDLLERLLPSYPRVADLHYYLGHARARAGDAWGALEGYERAIKLSRDPSYWLPLASLYLELGLHVYALRAFRRALKQPAGVPFVDEMRETVASLEQDLADAAHSLDIPVSQVEKGLFYLEDGQRVLRRGDYPASIAANRRAIRLLDDWPPPHNNLSLALFFDGQPEEAIAAARQVLSRTPQNIQALSNAIRFLAWTGQEPEARALWLQLERIMPQDGSDRFKIAEAAAVLGEDERVFQLLRPLDRPDGARDLSPGLARNAQLFLAVAEANTGRRRARPRLRALQDDVPRAGEFLAALEAGRPGPGWAGRFPYFHITDLLPGFRMDEFVELAGRQDEMPPERFRNQVARFVARFPQIVRVAEKMIWEEQQAEGGVAVLATVATPAAHAALRRFALSQAGEDAVRTRALASLLEAGEIAEDAVVRVWNQGQWREVQIRQVRISGQPQTQYTPEVSRLLDEALGVFQQDDHERAEQLFRRVLELEPRAREAYNNLGAIYSHRGEHAQAREMYQAAVELDPGYVFPRCNLAVYLLDEGDVEAAEVMLEPLKDATRFHPQEMAFLSYTRARVLIEREEVEAARRALQVALDVYPGYGPAENLLERLATITVLQSGYESFWERERKRRDAARARLQARLSTAEPALSEALSIYTKDVLTGMARVVLPWGGWSALRKAELHERIVAGLGDPDNLERIVADLDDDGRAALGQVLARGGHMPWQDFDAGYGNDTEESPYWQYHVPETTMGRLRERGLLVEATVDGELVVTVPSELRPVLEEMLG